MPRGGPDGGDGGDGGSVHLRADENLNTLAAFARRRLFAAGNGADGAGALKHGQMGDDVTIDVPVGTCVWLEGKQPRMLADLRSHGESVTVAQGGQGGRGNGRFASSTNRFPLLAEAGELGQSRTLRLELKLLADVGIVGLPNAGKSSLLAAVTRARPKVAEYPFTTLEPNLGVVEWRGESFVMVDIPGLIEGAHKGVGLGTEFLRHIERTDVLVHMVDAATEDPVASYGQINHELREHGQGLSDRPQVVALNKMDISGVEETAATARRQIEAGDRPVHLCSVVARRGLDGLLDSVLQSLRAVRSKTTTETAESAPRELPVLRPVPRDGVPRVSVDGDVFVIDLPTTARIAAMIDRDDWNARMQFYEHLRRRGVVKALEQLGISSGDTVRCGDLEWEWE